MHSTGEPVFENGKVVRLIGNTLDITEQENADTGAKASRGVSRASRERSVTPAASGGIYRPVN